MISCKKIILHGVNCLAFNSIVFGAFLVIVFMLYWILPPKFRWIVLLAASCGFYMSWGPQFVLLLLYTTIASYFCAGMVAKAKEKKHKKAWLWAGVLSSLAVLLFFKYFNFFAQSTVNVLRLFSLPVSGIALKILLPVGISFYTFQTLSYVIDVYRGKIEPEKHFGYYALFVSFFPQIVAGPIARPGALIPQLKEEQKFSYDKATYGLKLMAWGFFKKVAIADVAAIMINTVYSNVAAYKGVTMMAAAVLFSIQIYCDFSGYTDIARGAAKLFGYELMINFNAPYFSKSIKEFWQRWHISLSSWFRDYLYISLGGNRVVFPRALLNLFITFLVSGLWHGANWTFVIWGAYHGAFIVIETLFAKLSKKKKTEKAPSKLWSILGPIWVFFIVCVSWVFFRAGSFQDAVLALKNMTKIGSVVEEVKIAFRLLSLSKPATVLLAVNIATLFAFDFFSLKKDPIESVSGKPLVMRWLVYMLIALVVSYSFTMASNSSFIYAQF